MQVLSLFVEGPRAHREEDVMEREARGRVPRASHHRPSLGKRATFQTLSILRRSPER